VISVITLHRTYYLVDVTLLYVLLLTTSTIAFVLMAQGRTWVVLGASWLLWLLYQVLPDQADMPWPIAGNNLFHFAAWQVLFFTGLVIGHHWEALGKRASRLNRVRVLDFAVFALAVVIALYVVQDRLLSRLITGSGDQAAARAALVADITSKSDLRLGRLLVFALVFVVLFIATTEFWPILRRLVGWLVLPLGQRALYAYALHVLIALAVVLGLRRLGLPDNSASARTNAIIQVGTVLLVWFLVRFAPIPRRVVSQPLWLASPLILAVGLAVALPRIAPAVASPAPSPATTRRRRRRRAPSARRSRKGRRRNRCRPMPTMRRTRIVRRRRRRRPSRLPPHSRSRRSGRPRARLPVRSRSLNRSNNNNNNNSGRCSSCRRRSARQPVPCRAPCWNRTSIPRRSIRRRRTTSTCRRATTAQIRTTRCSTCCTG
jgi:hypothetical protein